MAEYSPPSPSRAARLQRGASRSPLDVPDINPAIARDPGVRARPEDFGAGVGAAVQGVGATGSKVAGAVGEDMARAQARRQARIDDIEQASVEKLFDDGTAQDIRDTSKQQDISSEPVLIALGSRMNDRIATLRSQYGGSPEGWERALAQLERRRGTYFGKAAALSHETASGKMSVLLKERFGESYARLAVQPEKLLDEWATIDSELALRERSLTPVELLTARSEARAHSAKISVDTLIARADFAGARAILKAEGVSAALNPVVLSALNSTVSSVEFETSKAIKEGRGIRAMIQAARPGISEEELNAAVNEKLGLVPKERKPVLVGVTDDKGAVVGSKYVEESEAVGMPGPPRTPVAQIMFQPEQLDQAGMLAFAKQAGGAEAKQVDEINVDARMAASNLVQIRAMRTAIDSGRFTTGVFADTRQFVAQLFEFLGASDNLKKLVGDAATADVIDQATKRLGVEEAKGISQRTNLGLKFIQESLPALSRTPEGNRILLEIMERVANRRMELADLANSYARDFKTLNPKTGKGEAPLLSFLQASQEIEKNDPVLTPELLQRIEDGTRNAPASFAELLKNTSAPPGYKPPKGFAFKTMRNGKIVLLDANGKEHVEE